MREDGGGQARWWRGLALALALLGAAGSARPVAAEAPPTPAPTTPPPPPQAPDVEARLRRLEEQNRELAEQNRALMERYESLMERHEKVLRRLEDDDTSDSGSESGARPGGDGAGASRDSVDAEVRGLESGAVGPMGEETTEGSERDEPTGDAGSGEGQDEGEGDDKDEEPPPFRVDYDDGFVIAPTDEDRTPFLLKINGRMQFRHYGFYRERDDWWDAAGVKRPIRNLNGFEIERGRLVFEGFFLDPRLQYYINLDFDTDDEHVVIAHDFWVNYEFGKLLNLYLGKAFVPGSREWIEGSTRMQFADRSLATTFFRPDRSVGIWAIGEPFERVFYRAMIANGFNTTDLTFEDIDNHFAYSGSLWWEALGDFGRGYSDLEWHEEPALRLGTSGTYSLEEGAGPTNQPLPEQNFVRLSDGTRLTDEGALAPGVTVNHFDIYLWALDAAWKYRGWSLNGEYYLRWLQEIRGLGGRVPRDHDNLFDHGFYLAAGTFVVPERLELIAKTSQIWGDFGTAAEYGGGFTWFPTGSHNLKFTFDATQVIGSPAQNSGPNYRVGETGVLFRSQLQAAF